MWPRLLNICLGVWLMASASWLGDAGGAARANSTIVGALAASFACIAIWGATRPLRWVNLVLGLWLVVAGWVLGFEATSAINGNIVGALMAALALVRGEVKEQFGGGWKAVWKSDVNGIGRTNKV